MQAISQCDPVVEANVGWIESHCLEHINLSEHRTYIPLAFHVEKDVRSGINTGDTL